MRGDFDSILLVVRQELMGVLVARLDIARHSLATPGSATKVRTQAIGCCGLHFPPL